MEVFIFNHVNPSADEDVLDFFAGSQPGLQPEGVDFFHDRLACQLLVVDPLIWINLDDV